MDGGKALCSIAHNGLPFLRLWPGAVSEKQFSISNNLFQVNIMKTGQCPQARQTEPRNMGGLERVGRSRPIYWASGGKNGVRRWTKPKLLVEAWMPKLHNQFL